MTGKALILAGLVLLLPGCRRSGTATTVARVDNTALTLEEIRGKLDTARGVTEAQVDQVVRQWLNDEVLFREAQRRGLDRASGLDERVADYRRQLVVQALLDQEIYNEASAACTPEEVRTYYEAHRSEFTLPQDVARISYLLFADRDAATAFRNAVLKGASWQAAAAQVEADPKQAVTVLGRTDSVYASQQSLQPPELWRVAANAKEHDVSFPIGTPAGYYVLTVWKFSRQGEPAAQELVEQEIRGRLTVQRRMRLYEGLVSNLRMQHRVEVFPSGLPTDTTKSKAVE